MEILLDIWRKIGNKILFKYYTEINIIDKYSFYSISFPLIVKNENEHQAQILIKSICKDLEKDFEFRRVDFLNPIPILNEKAINEKINKFYLGVNPQMIGEIEFNIYHGKNIKPKNIGFITNDKSLIDELGTYKFIDTQTINYKTINQLDSFLPPLEKILVKIMLTDIETLPENLTKEEQEDRIKYLMNYKPKK